MGAPLLKYLAAFCVLDNVGATCTGPQKMSACFTLWDPVCGSDGVTTYSNRCEAEAACQLDGSTPGKCTPAALPAPSPPCATPVDFALVLDESYSMNRKRGPDFMNGPNGVKAFAKELVRHAVMKPR